MLPRWDPRPALPELSTPARLYALLMSNIHSLFYPSLYSQTSPSPSLALFLPRFLSFSRSKKKLRLGLIAWFSLFLFKLYPLSILYLVHSPSWCPNKTVYLTEKKDTRHICSLISRFIYMSDLWFRLLPFSLSHNLSYSSFYVNRESGGNTMKNTNGRRMYSHLCIQIYLETIAKLHVFTRSETVINQYNQYIL